MTAAFPSASVHELPDDDDRPRAARKTITLTYREHLVENLPNCLRATRSSPSARPPAGALPAHAPRRPDHPGAGHVRRRSASGPQAPDAPCRNGQRCAELLAVRGSASKATAKIEASPTVLSFGGTTVGGHLSGGATRSATSAAPPLHDRSGQAAGRAVRRPAALPASGQHARTGSRGDDPGVPSTRPPTGNFNDELVLETSAGHVGDRARRQRRSPGCVEDHRRILRIRQRARGGGTATKMFTVENTGGTAVTITKSKPPVGASFSALSALAEGTTIAPGEAVTEMVAFKPGAPGYAGGVWTINGDDASGLHEVHFSGNGTVPAPEPGGRTTARRRSPLASCRRPPQPPSRPGRPSSKHRSKAAIS